MGLTSCSSNDMMSIHICVYGSEKTKKMRCQASEWCRVGEPADDIEPDGSCESCDEFCKDRYSAG